MDTVQHSTWESIMQRLIEEGPDALGAIFTETFNCAMQLEREQFLGAARYERTGTRRGYANGYQSKRLDTPAGTVRVRVPKTAGHSAEPFYPASLDRGRRSTRAVLLAAAEMFIQGVSTRDVEGIMRRFGIEGLSAAQVSRAMARLDAELERWRQRPLGETPYLILDAHYEKVRVDGSVQRAAVLTAVGVLPDGTRRLLGVSVQRSEAEVRWRSFLESLVARGMHGVRFVTADDHAGLRQAVSAVLGGAMLQRCQCHLSRNALHHAPNRRIRQRIGAQLRAVWNAADLPAAEAALGALVNEYRDSAPRLATWLEENVPEGFAALTLPESHRRRLRTTNPIERAVQQEIKRRTVKVRIFPNEAALERLVTAVLVEIDEEWATADRRYINWESQND